MWPIVGHSVAHGMIYHRFLWVMVTSRGFLLSVVTAQEMGVPLQDIGIPVAGIPNPPQSPTQQRASSAALRTSPDRSAKRPATAWIFPGGFVNLEMDEVEKEPFPQLLKIRQ